MDLGLTGKRAIVTGGSGGIGRAVARELVREGADVTITGRNLDVLADVADGLSAETSRRVLPMAVDTRRDEDVEALVAMTVAELGGVDILVNAAAEVDLVLTSLGELSDQVAADAFDTKLLGYLRCIRKVVPHMTAQGWGRIVNVSGMSARTGASLHGSMRNVAVVAMTKSIADELGGTGINVTAVHPAATRTEKLQRWLREHADEQMSAAELEAQLTSRTVIGRMVEPDEVAWVVAFLASPKSVAITGDVVAAGGGLRGAAHY